MALVLRTLVNGSLLDISDQGNNGTLTAGASRGFIKTERGLALECDYAVTYVDTGNAFVGFKSFAVWMKSTAFGGTRYVMGQRFNSTEVAGDWGLRTDPGSGGLIQLILFTGDGDFTISSSAAVTDRWYNVVGTADGTTLRLYFDGVEVDSTANVALFGDVNTNLLLGKNGHNGAYTYFDGFIQDVQIFDNVLTPAEVANIYNETKDGFQSTQTKRNFFYPAPQDLSNEVGLVGAWNMENTGGVVVDISGNGKNGTINGGLDAKGVFGRALSLDGTNDYLGCGDVADLGNTFTFSALVKANNFDNIGPIVCRDGVTNYNALIRFDTSGNIEFRQFYGAVEIRTAASYTAGEWLHIVGVSNAALAGVIYVNGVSAATGTFGASFSDVGNINLGRYASPGVTYFDGALDEVRVYNTALTATEVANLYNQVAKQVMLREDFSDEGADGVVGHPKGWSPETGIYKFNELSTTDSVLSHLLRGTKYLENVTAGRIGIQSKQAFGTWEFDFFKATGSTASRIRFISVDAIGSGVGRYTFNVEGSEEIVFGGPGGSTLWTSATAFIAFDTWYRAKITRSADGVFTSYIKGGAYGDTWTLITVASGTNPFTDTDILVSNYFVSDIDAGDSIANIEVRRGVV
jgi:hypothetical protein